MNHSNNLVTDISNLSVIVQSLYLPLKDPIRQILFCLALHYYCAIHDNWKVTLPY